MKKSLKKRFLHFDDIDEEIFDTKIYRYISYDEFREKLRKRRARFTNPAVWSAHDPYENVLFSIPCRQKGNSEKLSLNNLTRHFYAQCWTLSRESDLMWQVYNARYASNGGAIKIQTTIGLLLESQSHDFMYLGKVKYLTKSDFISAYRIFTKGISKHLVEDAGSGRVVAERLCYKRYPYRAEKEVRLILSDFVARAQNPIPEHIFRKFDVNKVVQRIVFDPRMDPAEYQNKKRILIKKGFENSIIQSSLYSVNEADFILK
ncbi:hypothetical protein [Bdellovibrio sp. HCB2-146]|uniref:hypothetical protein n=1 Tax=Bdellovibrio sp. HCB2-146 TaxID=3394362 RepID=UPI0039BD18D6